MAGRPRKEENSRNKSINIRLTEAELNKMDNVASALNATRTDTIVKGVELLEVTFVKKKRGDEKMSKWSENYIQSRLDILAEQLRNESEEWIKDSVCRTLEEEIQKEYAEIEGTMSDNEIERHMKKFEKEKEKELNEYFESLAEEDIYKEVEEERLRLEQE